jgi:hypothetical protein
MRDPARGENFSIAELCRRGWNRTLFQRLPVSAVFPDAAYAFLNGRRRGLCRSSNTCISLFF